MIVYGAFNTQVFNTIPTSAKSMLDIGCGTGEIGRAFKKLYDDVHVTGVTYSEEEAATARKNIDEVITLNINDTLFEFKTAFDCIIFSHILEHTYDPVKVLKHFAKFLKVDGLIIIALPNVLFYKQRWQFLKGNFKYSKEGGLMDTTHFRFFDYETAQGLLIDAGLNIVSKGASGNFPLGPIRRILPRLAVAIDNLSLSLFPGLFGFQFILSAKK